MSDVRTKMGKLGIEIANLKIEYEELRTICIKEVQEKLSILVGMSFKDLNNDYFRIINVPRPEYNKSYTSFNEYQIPVLVCYTDSAFENINRIRVATRFSMASSAEDPVECIRSEYTEVSAEEFDAELEKAFDEIRALGKRGDFHEETSVIN